jgi:hypothetical protein
MKDVIMISLALSLSKGAPMVRQAHHERRVFLRLILQPVVSINGQND